MEWFKVERQHKSHRTKKDTGPSTKELAYKPIIRSLLVSVDPYQIGLIEEMEKMQKRAARFITESFIKHGDDQPTPLTGAAREAFCITLWFAANDRRAYIPRRVNKCIYCSYFRQGKVDEDRFVPIERLAGNRSSLEALVTVTAKGENDRDIESTLYQAPQVDLRNVDAVSFTLLNIFRQAVYETQILFWKSNRWFLKERVIIQSPDKD